MPLRLSKAAYLPLRIVRAPASGRFPDCKSPSGQTYETHPCTAVPQGGKSITIACQEEKVTLSEFRVSPLALGVFCCRRRAFAVASLVLSVSGRCFFFVSPVLFLAV